MESFFEKMKKSFLPKYKEFRLSLHLMNRNKLSQLSMIILIILVVAAILAPYIAPYPGDIYGEVHMGSALQPPSKDHILGTDEVGRDIFSRLLQGTRISLACSIIIVLICAVFGAILGAAAGTLGRWIDDVLMRITDIFMAFPPLLLTIAFSALLGASLKNAIIAMMLTWWPPYARLMRNSALTIRERPYVKAAEAIGTKKLRITVKHIMPNCIAPLIIQASMDMGAVILSLASLSFLGLGAQSPQPEWGLMISTSRAYFLNCPWYSIFPGLAIVITVLAMNLIGDGLREVLDPKTKKN